MIHKGDTVLIVGSRGSIGKAIADLLTASGYSVVGFIGDATDALSVRSFLNASVKIDHIVYSASAKIQHKAIDKEEADSFRKHYDVSVIGLLNIVQAALDGQDLRSIIIIGSSSTFGDAPARLSAYTTAKYAQVGLMKSLASDLKSRNVRVNMISPGLTGEGASKDFPEAIKEFTRHNASEGRLVSPDDVARIALGILSSDGPSGENRLLDNVE